jgi:hypothetical protein
MARKRDPRYGKNPEDWAIRDRKDLSCSLGVDRRWTLAGWLMLAAEEAFGAARAKHEVGAVIARLVEGPRFECEVVRSNTVLLVTKVADIEVDFSVYEYLEPVVSG